MNIFQCLIPFLYSGCIFFSFIWRFRVLFHFWQLVWYHTYSLTGLICPVILQIRSSLCISEVYNGIIAITNSSGDNTISSSHYSNRKAAGHCSMVRFKEEYPPHRIDCPLGRKPGGSTRAEENPLRDTACRLRGKGLDMPCDSYWGWLSWFYRTLSHFVSFQNRNHWP